jgi:glycine/D-amino acid oxidase-like deaminating enzyme
VPRAGLRGPTQADVAIIGAGYTGLWSAYYLAKAAPGLRIVVVEREFAGFGASGRNGGWCSALFPLAHQRLAALAGREGTLAQQRALDDTVTEVGGVAANEGIDAHFAQGGKIALARTPVQLDRARAQVQRARAFRFDSSHIVLLDAEAARDLLGAADVLGATYSAHCAALHPARLVRGLASAVERAGVRLYEGTAVTEITPGRVVTDHGTVHAPFVVRATEGYTPQLRGHRRTLAPVYSLMLATEALPPAFWEEVGLRRREVFTDYRHLVIYGQRTADDRFAFGGRGAPYHLGSRVHPAYDREPAVFAELHRILVELFPALAGVAITHTWGGPLGVPRDWFPSVGLDRATGMGWAGGYVGDGVAAANLAGRTLADLILERDTELVTLPWVQHRSPNWEPEPLRWLGATATRRMMAGADVVELRTGRNAERARLMARWLGQ